MKKRNMAGILTAVLVCCAAAVPVFAGSSTTITDQTADPKNATVDLSTQIDPTYTVVIPQETGIAFRDLTKTISVKYAKGNLEPGASVRVSTSKQAVLKHDRISGTADADEQIVFSVSADGSAGNSGTPAVVFAEGTAVNTLKDFTLATTAAEWNSAKSGTYSGEMVFTISYDDGTGN